MKQCAISCFVVLGKFDIQNSLKRKKMVLEWRREGSAVGSGLRRKKRKYCPKLLTFQRIKYWKKDVVNMWKGPRSHRSSPAKIGVFFNDELLSVGYLLTVGLRTTLRSCLLATTCLNVTMRTVSNISTAIQMAHVSILLFFSESLLPSGIYRYWIQCLLISTTSSLLVQVLSSLCSAVWKCVCVCLCVCVYV